MEPFNPESRNCRPLKLVPIDLALFFICHFYFSLSLLSLAYLSLSLSPLSLSLSLSLSRFCSHTHTHTHTNTCVNKRKIYFCWKQFFWLKKVLPFDQSDISNVYMEINFLGTNSPKYNICLGSNSPIFFTSLKLQLQSYSRGERTVYIKFKLLLLFYVRPSDFADFSGLNMLMGAFCLVECLFYDRLSDFAAYSRSGMS